MYNLCSYWRSFFDKNTAFSLSLSLSLWLWHFYSEPDSKLSSSVKSSKVKEMSGIWVFYDGVFEQRLTIKTPASKPSNSKNCESENLIRGKDKFLSTKRSALANRILLVSFYNVSIWFVRFCLILWKILL